MINDQSKTESLRIAKSLNIRLVKCVSGLQFTEDGDDNIALLDITKASLSISHRMRNDPSTAHNLRWVRDTETNKRILANYLIKRLIIYLLNYGPTFYYTPCCNSFSQSKNQNQQRNKVTRTSTKTASSFSWEKKRNQKLFSFGRIKGINPRSKERKSLENT